MSHGEWEGGQGGWKEVGTRVGIGGAMGREASRSGDHWSEGEKGEKGNIIAEVQQ